MTWRSAILGVLGAAAICSFAFFHDHIIMQGMLVPHQMPPFIYCALIVGIVIVGLICRYIGRLRPLSAAEWAVIGGLWLVGCGIPGWGLVECVPPTAIMTHQYARLEPGWRSDKVDVVATVPSQMLVDIESEGDAVLSGYVAGLAQGNEHIALSAVPWANWAPSMTFWLPFVLAFTPAMFGLAAVVHRQWAHHESLPYPITAFAHALLPGEDGGVAIFRDRLFWLGAIPALLLYSNNYLASWFSEELVSISLSVDLSSLYEIFPFLDGHGFRYRLSLAVVGLAYFLRTNVALSVGVVPYLHTAFAVIMAGYGISLTGGGHLGGSYNSYMFAGGYLGMLLLLLYTGRHYYWNALHQSLFFPTSEAGPSELTRRLHAGCIGLLVAAVLYLVIGAGVVAAAIGGLATGALHVWGASKAPVHSPVDPQAVWGMRVFLLGMLGVLAALVWLGLDWQLALAFAGLAVMTVVVISRAVAETGAFVFGTYFLPGGIILGFAGATAFGPEPMMIIALASSALLLAPGWAPMAFMVQALKLADLAKADVHKTAKASMLAVIICVPLALGCILYWSYDRGAPVRSWPHHANRYFGNDVVQSSNRLQAQGRLEQAQALQGWQRLRAVSPERPLVLAFVMTAALAVLFGWCGLRFTKWPFHPVMFLFLGSFHGQWLSVSLLCGCALKAGVAQFAGAACYNRLKPVMIGLIAGSVVAATIPIVVGVVYYLITGSVPQRAPGVL
jgi:hypothetical protein